jgi:hypothetical protein
VNIHWIWILLGVIAYIVIGFVIAHFSVWPGHSDEVYKGYFVLVVFSWPFCLFYMPIKLCMVCLDLIGNWGLAMRPKDD